MKKILAMLLAAAMTATMAVSLTACNGDSDVSSVSSGSASSEDTTSSAPESSEPEAPAGENKVVIGSDAELDANMMAGWTNGATNANIRHLLFGYDAVAWTRDQGYIFNPQVVKEESSVVNEDGTKTYTVTIHDDLVWNDGTPITVKDYIFATMLYASPEFRSTDGGDTVSNANKYVGYKAYFDGTSDKKFTGIRMIDDYTYSVTIVAEELPYFFDTTYASLWPLPMSVIAPGCDIVDDGTGAQITGEFTNELLAETINTVGTGYRYMPKVTCGPYQLTAYNDGDKQATLTINPNFKGTYDGVKPSIETIVVKKTVPATSMDELLAGSVDMLDATPDGPQIENGLDHVEAGEISYVSYDRAGYGQIQFSCDFGPTQFPEVRQAIAYCLDRDNFVKQFTLGHGSVVNGPYGLSQWEYKDNKAALDERLNPYTYNVDTAKQVLIDGGWTLNADGNDFVEGTDTVRYKKLDDSSLMGLEIEWLATPTDENPVAALLSQMLPSEMEKAGMKLNMTTVEFSVLLENLYRTPGGAYSDPPKYHMFNLATGFVPIPDFKYSFSMDPQYDGDWNNNFLHDQQLADLANTLMATPSGDNEKWSENWVNFMDRWNQLLPNIPLYANIYHVFMSNRVQNYNPNPDWEWGYELVYASMK